jgi:hypothetical protein
MPAGQAPGSYTIDAAYADSVGNFQDSLDTSHTLIVQLAPTITSLSSTIFALGAANTFTVETTGYPTGPSMSITEGGALPKGVTFTNSGNGTATLAGTPANGTKGTYFLTITAANGVTPSAVQHFTLYVRYATTVHVTASPDPSLVGAPVLAVATIQPGDSGGTFSFWLSYDGGTPTPIANCQQVPDFFNSAYCLLFPRSTGSAGSYTITADFSGDSNYVAESGSGTLLVTYGTGISLRASSPATHGTPVTVTATVFPTPDGGTVSFHVQPPFRATAPVPSSCTNASLTAGSATCTFTPSASGVYEVSVNYSGDALYLPSSTTGFLIVR